MLKIGNLKARSAFSCQLFLQDGSCGMRGIVQLELVGLTNFGITSNSRFIDRRLPDLSLLRDLSHRGLVCLAPHDNHLLFVKWLFLVCPSQIGRPFP